MVQISGYNKISLLQYLQEFRTASEGKLGKNLPFKIINDNILDAMCAAAKEVSEGTHFEHFIIPAVQGGAGTSLT